MFPRFGLTLVVTHACNLRCTYCYTGEKSARSMPLELGRRAIDCAFASVRSGGAIDVGFFGGEPLIEAANIQRWMDHARRAAAERRIGLAFNLTTNGTRTDAAASGVMMSDDLDLVISHDGLPAAHDLHRRSTGGHGTAEQVEATIRRFIEAGRTPRVNLVVRPDTLDDLPAGIRRLRELGVTHTDLSLDVWAAWSDADVARLERAVESCAGVWREGLPGCGINWFDLEAIEIAGLGAGTTTRCGFGRGEAAVAPSGRVYPCERLVGKDPPDHPQVLARLEEIADFIGLRADCAATGERGPCRCSNLVRSGDPERPDRLLSRWAEACREQTRRRVVILEGGVLGVRP